MKKRFGMMFLLLILGGLTLVACDSLGVTPADEQAGTQKTIYVGPELVDCVGVAPQQCLQVKENPEDEYTLWYSGIEGFEFEEGFEYVLLVNETQIENPPADGSSILWTLVEEVSKTPVAATEGDGETGETDAATIETDTPVEEAAAGATLEGTYWTLVFFAGEDGTTIDALEDVTVSAEFAEGQITGNAGCNNYFGSYVTDGDSITIGPIGATMMLCQPDELMTQESGYLRAIESAQTFTIADGQLTLFGADGNPVALFQATELPTLAGPTWLMTGYNNGAGGVVSPLGGTTVTAEFDGKGNLSGSAGCNNYNAGYQADENTIAIEPPLTTRKFCAEPEGIMDQEAQYLAAIQNATVYTISGNTLELRDDGGALQASYQVLDEETVNTVLRTALGNITYKNEFTASGEAPLADGEYSEPVAPDSATETRVFLTDDIAVGTFSDGRTGVAVILVTDPGGSGTFYDLAAVASQDGALTNVATTLLGDRVVINALEIVDGQIVVDMVQAGPDDPMATPTQNVVNTYELQGEELVQIASELVEEAAETDADSAEPTLTNTDWRLVQFQGGDGAVIDFEADGAYNVVFNDDGSLGFTADCNSGNGSYTVDGSSLSIELGAMTMAACPEESFSDRYVQTLGDVVSYVFDDNGNLVLNLMLDSGNLVFVDSEASESGAVAEPPAAAEANGIVGVTWQWNETQSPVETIAVPNPENYTILLNEDGTFNYQADCNVGSGTYALDGNSIAFDLGGPTTLAFCGENSLDTQFLTALGAAAIYFTENGDLFIDMMADGGTLRFTEAGAVADSAEPTLQNTDWRLIRFEGGDDTIIDFEADGAYSIVFTDDGSLGFNADCNSGNGGYTVDGSSLSIELGAMTMAACPEGSFSDQYVQNLGDVVSYVFDDDGNLVLNLMLDAGNLVFVDAAAAEGDTEAGEIVDVVWKWEALTTPVEQTTVDTPESYLLLLNPDGTVSIQADCNSGGGNYTIDGSGISIEILFTTAAFCGEDSLDQLFINSLNNAAIYFTEEGDLFIDQAFDSGTMRFSAVDNGA